MEKEKNYITSTNDMIEGVPMTREAFKNLTLKVADEWVRDNHPEIKKEWINICRNKQEIIKLFPEKKKSVKMFDDNGNPVMKSVKKRDGTIVEKQKTVEVPYEKGEKRLLNAFEITTWLCAKYGMLPEAQSKGERIRDTLGNW